MCRLSVLHAEIPLFEAMGTISEPTYPDQPNAVVYDMHLLIEDFIREPFRLSACPAIIFHSISNLKLVQ